MMSRNPSLTRAYSLVQAGFWMSYCAVISYAAVYLQALGFDNFTLGAVLASGNVLGALIGPAIATRLDRRQELATAVPVRALLGTQAPLLAALWLCAGKNALTALLYALLIGVSSSVNSVNLRFCGDAAKRGADMNFGLARGFGSAAYTVLSALLGLLLRRFAPALLPAACGAVLIFQTVCNERMNALLNRLSPTAAAAKELTQAGDSLLRFLRGEPRFALLLLGNILIFFGHNTGTNFTINLVRGVGGDASVMGLLNAYMAVLEIPVMMLFSRIRRRFRLSALLRLSFVAFALKLLAVALASTVAQLFAAFLLQACSFALYASAIVEYTSEVISGRNAAKGQSLAYTVTIIGAVLTSLISGRLFDLCTVRETMLISFAVCAVGAVLSVLGTKNVN